MTQTNIATQIVRGTWKGLLVAFILVSMQPKPLYVTTFLAFLLLALMFVIELIAYLIDNATDGYKRLHVYANDVTEWVIAYSPDDAKKVIEETTGDKYDEDCGEFTQCSDKGVLALYIDEEMKHYVEKTYHEWALSEGRKILSSDEWC